MLDRRQRSLLLFEDAHPDHDVDKVTDIRQVFSLGPAEYYALLGRILSDRDIVGSDRRLADRIRERIAASLDGRIRPAGDR